MFVILFGCCFWCSWVLCCDACGFLLDFADVGLCLMFWAGLRVFGLCLVFCGLVLSLGL